MTNLTSPERSPGLRIALGIDRLKYSITVASKRTNLVAAWNVLDPSTQRFIVKACLLAIASGLGFWGFIKPGRENLSESWWQFLLDCAFKTVQLFTTQYSAHATPIPWQTEVARFALPGIALWLAVSALFRRFNRRTHVWFASRGNNHVVLIGASDVSVALARAYREKLHRRVIAILPADPGDAIPKIEKEGAAIVVGDPNQTTTLRAAGVDRAAALIAADDVGGAIIGLGSAVGEVTRSRSQGRPRLPVVMRLSHRELRELATAHLSSALRESRADLRLYVRERTIARALLSRYPADWGLLPGVHDIHAAIFGFGEMGGEILLQLARIAVPSPGRRTVLTVIDRDADALEERTLADYPGLRLCVELRFIKADVRPSAITKAEIEKWLLSPLPATAIYVCCGDDQVNLTMTVGLRRAYARAGATSAPIFVDQFAGSVQVDALPQMHGHGIDTLRIVPFGSVEEEADPFYMIEEEIDDLARRLHENYLAGLGPAPTSPEVAASRGPAAVPWLQLEDTYRAANRSQADHILMKLRALGLHATDGTEPATFNDWITKDEPRLETIAAQEHERWCRDRWLGGWTYAEARNNARRQHPDLIAYDRLGEVEQNKDRQTIHGLPSILAGVGVGLKRDIRIGIWFESDRLEPSKALVEELLTRVDRRMATEPSLHLQLIMPLRVSAELTVATTLAGRYSVATDVALLGGPAIPDIGSAVDRRSLRILVETSDRASFLKTSEEVGMASESMRLAALCDVCDSVLVAYEEADSASALLHQIGESRKTRVELVSLRF